MLVAVRAIHTIIFLVMAASVLYIVYCGLVDKSGPGLLVALSLVALECAVFVGNGMKCPLTNLAQQYGAKKGYVFDAFIPERLTRYTVPVFGSLLILGLLLLVVRAIL